MEARGMLDACKIMLDGIIKTNSCKLVHYADVYEHMA